MKLAGVCGCIQNNARTLARKFQIEPQSMRDVVVASGFRIGLGLKCQGHALVPKGSRCRGRHLTERRAARAQDLDSHAQKSKGAQVGFSTKRRE
jgi:hypothetical protein